MIGVTVTSSPIGSLTIDNLLERGVPAERIIALVQDPDSESAVADKGVATRRVDYNEAATVHAAIKGVEKLLFVPAPDIGKRLIEAEHVVEAAKYEGVGLLLYLSILNADTNMMALATEHVGTEQLIKENRIPHLFLRHTWYLENYTHYIPHYLKTGTMLGAAGKGRIAAASRNDIAEAAAVLLTEDHGIDRTFELAGDEPFTYQEFAEMLTRLSGTTVNFEQLDPEALTDALQDQGLSLEVASMKSDRDAGIARGDLDSVSSDLTDLIHRPSLSLREAISRALP